jgi:hypothetical protein
MNRRRLFLGLRIVTAGLLLAVASIASLPAAEPASIWGRSTWSLAGSDHVVRRTV